jgi:hypothetical protein
MSKPCRSCGSLLSLDAFTVDRGKSDGRATRCRPCARERAKENRKERERRQAIFEDLYQRLTATVQEVPVGMLEETEGGREWTRGRYWPGCR